MGRSTCWRCFVLAMATMFWAGLSSGAQAQGSESDKIVRLAASAQIVEVFRNTDILTQLERKTGVKVEYESMDSDAALARLANEVSDAAAIAHSLELHYKREGYMQHPFAKDALVFVTNPQNKVQDLTPEQIRKAFSGVVDNWKEIEGSDDPITIVIPRKHSALFQNFSRMFMEGQDVDWDIMTASSTDAFSVARRYPGGLSFVNKGATHGKPEGAKVLKVNGLSPNDPAYPYYEVFSIVTRGEPSGPVKALLEFAKSKEVVELMKELNIIPVE